MTNFKIRKQQTVSFRIWRLEFGICLVFSAQDLGFNRLWKELR